MTTRSAGSNRVIPDPASSRMIRTIALILVALCGACAFADF